MGRATPIRTAALERPLAGMEGDRLEMMTVMAAALPPVGLVDVQETMSLGRRATLTLMADLETLLEGLGDGHLEMMIATALVDKAAGTLTGVVVAVEGMIRMDQLEITKIITTIKVAVRV